MQPTERREGSGCRRQGREIGFLVPIPDQDLLIELAFAPSTDGYRALAVNDVSAGLLQLVGRHVGHRLVIIAEDRGVEIPVLGVGSDDRAPRPAIDRYAIDKHVIALCQIVFEAGETANARPPAPPGSHVAALDGASTVHPAVIVSETPSGAVAEPASTGCGIARPTTAASPQAAANIPSRPNAGIGPIPPLLVRHCYRRLPPFRRAGQANGSSGAFQPWILCNRRGFDTHRR